MNTYVFIYVCLGTNYILELKGKDINESLLFFAKHYSDVEEIKSVKIKI